MDVLGHFLLGAYLGINLRMALDLDGPYYEPQVIGQLILSAWFVRAWTFFIMLLFGLLLDLTLKIYRRINS